MPESTSVLQELFVYFLAAVLAVPGARYLGLGPFPGYLLLGFIIGPWGLAVVRDAGHIRQFADFGVVVMLFLIGLQLAPAKILAWKQAILRAGGTQLAACTALMFIVAAMLNSPWREAFVAAMTLALCSSAVPLYYLHKHNQQASAPGRLTQHILLAQQLAFVPILLLIPPLSLGAPADALERWLSVFKGVLVIVVVLFVGRLILRHAYRYIAAARLPDVFIAFSLLFTCSVILLMSSLGLPLGLGAFLCGVLMIDSEYHRDLKRHIDPFQGLLLGLFFISVGMGIDFGLVFQRPAEILGLVLALILIKSLVVYAVATRAGIEAVAAWRQAVLLAQCGELTFLLLAVAANNQAIPDKLGAVLTVVVAVSLLLTPVLLAILRRYEPRIASTLPRQPAVVTSKSATETRPTPVDSTTPEVVVAGFGRVGQTIARFLRSDGIEISIVDHDPEHLELLRQHGFQVFYGNSLRTDLLRQAGAASARVLVVAIDDREQALTLVANVRRHFPHLEIVARTRDMPHQWQLSRAGVRHLHRETFASAVLMGEDVIALLGRDYEEVERISEAFRDHDARVLDDLEQRDAQERPVTQTHREHDLTLLLERDAAQRELEQRVERGEEERG